MGIEQQTDDEDADMAAGFSGEDEASDDEVLQTAADKKPAAAPAPTPAPAPAAEAPAPTPAPAPAPAPAVDPFASMPAEVRALLAEVPSLRAENQSMRRELGQVRALQREIEQIRRAMQPSAAPTPAPQAEPKRGPKLSAIATDLPEVAEAIEELRAEMQAAVPATPAPAPAPAPAAADDPVSAEERVLNRMRPTWGNDVQSVEFKLWLGTQPADYAQTVRTTGQADVLLEALQRHDAYRESLRSQQATLDNSRQRRIERAVTPRGEGRRQQPARVAAGDDEEDDMAEGFRQGR